MLLTLLLGLLLALLGGLLLGLCLVRLVFFVLLVFLVLLLFLVFVVSVVFFVFFVPPLTFGDIGVNEPVLAVDVMLQCVVLLRVSTHRACCFFSSSNGFFCTTTITTCFKCAAYSAAALEGTSRTLLRYMPRASTREANITQNILSAAATG